MCVLVWRHPAEVISSHYLQLQDIHSYAGMDEARCRRAVLDMFGSALSVCEGRPALLLPSAMSTAEHVSSFLKLALQELQQVRAASPVDSSSLGWQARLPDVPTLHRHYLQHVRAMCFTAAIFVPLFSPLLFPQFSSFSFHLTHVNPALLFSYTTNMSQHTIDTLCSSTKNT